VDSQLGGRTPKAAIGRGRMTLGKDGEGQQPIGVALGGGGAGKKSLVCMTGEVKQPKIGGSITTVGGETG